MAKEEIREKYMELQYLQEQLKDIREQVQTVESQTLELEQNISYIDDLKSVEKDQEIFVPVCNGIFAKAKMIDNESFIVNVGANVMVKKNSTETKALLEEQKLELQHLVQKMKQEFNKMAERTKRLQIEVQSMIEEDQKKDSSKD